MKEIELELNGLNCAGCAGKIEKLSRQIEGVEDASLDFVSKKLKINVITDDEANIVTEEIKKKMCIRDRITPAHATFWNSEQEGYEYNPEKAKQILDEAGYIDKDGDGMREDPNGNKLKINFLSMSGGDIAEPLAQFYVCLLYTS